ncbi:MAM domain-containing protein 2-like [Scleropages formosus]|uniref:MAM domain-containing protein 2-like n=1 Tax=Scleropages formosus TaxID=113540 RepID=UPI0010FA6655|nr:MAM domain-containing protein 2-like [Scleropages formosus]
MLLLFLLTPLVLTTGEPLSGSCSFAQGTCGYTSDPAFAEWTRSADGHFLIIDHTLTEGVEKAVLVSPELELLEWSCLRVVYQITGSGSLWLYQRPEGHNFDTRLWATDAPSDSWLTASVDLRNSSVSCKVIFEGHLGPKVQSSVAIIKVDIVPGYCIECGFEESNLCAYSTPWSTGVSWYVGGSSAHSGDATWSNETGCYMYADSVFGKEVAKLVSPMTTTPLAGCLSFYYRSDQESNCFFNVLTRDQLGQYRDIWRAEINRTSGWTLAQVDFRAPYPLEVVFEVAFNSHVGGRMALDDISFSPQFCYSETEVTFDPSVANCDFEEGLCSYKPEQAGWSRVSVKPNIFRLGDHTTGSGSFLMANTRLIPPPAYMSLLYGPSLPGNLTYCLRFYYTLSGFTRMDHALTVYSSDHIGGAEEEIWTVTESTRNVWTEVHVTFQRRQATKVLFVSMCSNYGDCGSVGLDDISMSLGDCRLTAGPLLSAPGTCTFEMGICEFSQDKDNDSGKWVLTRGPTPTSYTGPMGDHTTGTGHYMYLEASQMRQGHRARLVSNKQRGSGSPQCLHFHYHMYGSGTGELRVLLQLDGEESYVLLWSRHGEQGISWMKGSVSYQSDRQHQIVFEAIRGTSVRSDIAIDDIVFKKGSCQEVDTNPYYSFSENVNKIEY